MANKILQEVLKAMKNLIYGGTIFFILAVIPAASMAQSLEIVAATPTPAPAVQPQAAISFASYTCNETIASAWITFTNGSSPLAKDVTIDFRANFWLDGDIGPTGGFQTNRPLQPNYAALNSETVATGTISLISGLVNVQKRLLRVRVIDGAIDPGESFRINLNNLELRSDALGSNAEDHAFWCAVGDPNGSNPEPDSGVTYNIIPVSGGRLLPLPVDYLYPIVPSRVRAGEEVSLRISVLDEYDNLVPGAEGTILISCTDPQAEFTSSTTLTPGDAGTKTIPVILRTAGIQRFTAALAEFSSTTGTSNVIAVTAGTPDRILWGDYHNHSLRCDGTGDPGGKCRVCFRGGFSRLVLPEQPRCPALVPGGRHALGQYQGYNRFSPDRELHHHPGV